MRHRAAAFGGAEVRGGDEMGPFPDGNRPQMEAPGAGTMLVSLPSTKFRPA